MNPLVLLLSALLGALLFGAGVGLAFWVLQGHRTPIGEVRRQEVKPTRLPAPAPEPMPGMVTPPPGFRPTEPAHRFVPTSRPLTEDALPPPPPRKGAGPYAYGARSPEESSAMFEEMQDALRRRELGGPFDDAYGA